MNLRILFARVFNTINDGWVFDGSACVCVCACARATVSRNSISIDFIFFRVLCPCVCVCVVIKDSTMTSHAMRWIARASAHVPKYHVVQVIAQSILLLSQFFNFLIEIAFV